jgi:GT2 family glycosyltransferase
MVSHYPGRYRCYSLRDVPPRLGPARVNPTERLKRWLALWNRRRLHQRQLRRRQPYAEWSARYDQPDAAIRAAIERRLADTGPLPEVELLLLAAADAMPEDHTGLWNSLRSQWHVRWRLHVKASGTQREAWQRLGSGDPRLVLWVDGTFDDRLAEASGPWCAFVDAHDRWREHALVLLLEAAARRPQAQVVYADEDRIDASGQRLQPWFKPDFDPDALLAQDVLGSPVLWRRERVHAMAQAVVANGPGPGHRAVLAGVRGLGSDGVVHVPHVLASRVADNAAVQPPAGDPQAVAEHLAALGEPVLRIDQAAEGSGVRIAFACPEPAPRVLLVVPTRNGLHLLRQCVQSIQRRTRYPNWRLVIVDNGSDDPACLGWLQAIAQEDPRISVRRDDRPFNFAALNNAAILDEAAADCDFVALVNNDIEVITPDWLDELVGLACRPGVGAVGARLWYADGTLQHGGVIVDIGLGGGHVLKHSPRAEGGPGARQWRMQGYLAVTGACLLVRRRLYLEVGGMDEAAFGIACNDIDLCLKLVHAGHRTLWTPHAELFHHESVSRGKDHDPVKKQRLLDETGRLRARWREWTTRDPFHNPNLDLHSEQFALAREPRVGLDRPWWMSGVAR